MFDAHRIGRRAFLRTTAASLAAPALLRGQSTGAVTLYNGITLPNPWPPRLGTPDGSFARPPYLVSPPRVVDISVGRQLFVDDFLIEESGLHRAFHRASYHPANPILRPERPWETADPRAAATKTPPNPSAMVFSDGVFFDPADRLFKMWYMAGYQQGTALATSTDGLAWTRPALPVVPGTNIVWPSGRDSSTVWLDLETADRNARYKMASFVFADARMHLSESSDGIHWRRVGSSGPCDDRSTFFRNPFRNAWVFSLRANDDTGVRRYRKYIERERFAGAPWQAADPVPWVAADTQDGHREDLTSIPELYNVDAVAYESVMLGLFTMFRGENRLREKPNDLCVAFSRDGFHWDRSARDPFLGVSENPGDWNWANVQSAGGGCLVVGDQLFVYVSGRKGVPGTDLPGECTTGLATLRRDGFASLSDEWPDGVPRRVVTHRSSVTTRPMRFRGSHLFLNAAARGDIRVEVLDEGGRVRPGFSADDCVAVTGDATKQRVAWRGQQTLADLSGEVIRLRFVLSRARLYAFWIADGTDGQSRGYVAAGGPGFSSATDGR